MGLGAYPAEDELSLDMLGMHGSVYANKAVDEADLLIALGVRFDDRVTGKVEEFCKHGKIIHVDIDASELNKNKEAHIPVVRRCETRARASSTRSWSRPRIFPTGLAHCQQLGSRQVPFKFDRTYPGITSATMRLKSYGS